MSIASYSFSLDLITGSTALGRGAKQETLALFKICDLRKAGNLPSLFVAAEGWSSPCHRTERISDDLPTVIEALRRSILSPDAQQSSGWIGEKSLFDRFVTGVNELIKKRNNHIDASSWIKLLDVVLKILTLGLFSYKESLKIAPLNVLYWNNAFNQDYYQFLIDESFTYEELSEAAHPEARGWDVRGYEATLLDRFFHGKVRDLPSSPESSVKAFMGELPRSTNRISPLPSTARSEWSEEQIRIFTEQNPSFLPETSAYTTQSCLKRVSEDIRLFGVSYANFLKANPNFSKKDILSSIDKLFNTGVLKGALLIHSNDPHYPVRIAIRRLEGDQFALLLLKAENGRPCSYKVGAPLDIRRALPESLFRKKASLSIIPFNIS